MDPIQPFFALSSDKYYKRISKIAGVAHIYEYLSGSDLTSGIYSIPDGCIDIIFDEDSSDFYAFAAGTVLKGTPNNHIIGHHYFGIRFLPGVTPAFLDGKFHEFTNSLIDLDSCSKFCTQLKDQIYEKKTFREKADAVESLYLQALSKACQSGNSKSILVTSIKSLIEDSQGNIPIHQIEAQTGYTSRYIDKVFKESTGLTPKNFCKIIRFQSAINHLDHDNHILLTDLAADHGYYDQPQFIRDFKKYSKMTPNQYRKQIMKSNYTDKFIFA